MKWAAAFFILWLPAASVILRAQVQQAPKLFALSDFSGALTLRYQMTDEEEYTGESLLREVDRNFLEGGFQLNTVGSIYHPNLLTFRVSANIIGHRQKTRYSEDPSFNNALNNTYNIRLNFLKKKKLNLDVYTIRNVFTMDRAFLERYFTTFSNTGAVLRSRTKILPFQLDVYRSRITSESLTYEERDEKSDNVDLRMDLIKGPRTRSTFNFKYKDYSESVYQVDYRTLDGMVNFTHNYGVRDRSLVNSYLSYRRMRGYYNLETFQGRLNNVHYLKSYLHLNTTYQLIGDNSPSRSFKKHDIRTVLNHQLFDSLTTRLETGGRIEDADTQDVRGFRYGVELLYRKKIPTGSIMLSYLNRRENGNYISNSESMENSEVYDFELTDAIILTQPGIETASIQVLSVDLSVVYIEGVDFRVDAPDDVITITRLPGGAIPAGARVRVRFRSLAYPDYRYTLGKTQFHFRLNVFRYLTLFYIGGAGRHDIRSDYTVPPFETYDKKNLGAQFLSRFLNLSYTYEDYDSTLTAYKGHNLRGAGHVNLFKRLKLSANAGFNRLNYDLEDYYTEFLAYSFECGYTPRPNLNANALYRRIRYETLGRFRDRESMVFKFRWTIRNIIVDVFYERVLTLTDTLDRGRDFFSLMIRRTF